MSADPQKKSFFSLTTDRVIDSLEGALSRTLSPRRATGRVMALNSLENRVYEVEFEDGVSVVSKFYRPGRWSRDQLLEEHRFLQKLNELEIPVVAPLSFDALKSTLGQTEEGIFFTAFPKVKGRLCDELNETQLQALGRYLGRMHRVGQNFPLRHRLRLTPQLWGETSLDYLLKSRFLDDAVRPHYQQAAREFLDLISLPVQNAKVTATHGDCHLGNVLWSGDAPFFIDFDDLCTAPPTQDVWMCVRGRDEQAVKDRSILLSSYEAMHEFDRGSLRLIEPLRGLRIIHYSAWIAKRWDDPSFPNAFPNYGTAAYWRSEIEALREIIEATRTAFAFDWSFAP